MAEVNEQLGSFVNAQQLAKILGISRAGVFALLRRGAMPKGIKIGHNRRWAVKELKAWLEGQKGANDDE